MWNYVLFIFWIFGVINILEDGFCLDFFQCRVKLWELILLRVERGREVNVLVYVNYKIVKKILRFYDLYVLVY